MRSRRLGAELPLAISYLAIAKLPAAKCPYLQNRVSVVQINVDLCSVYGQVEQEKMCQRPTAQRQIGYMIPGLNNWLEISRFTN